LEIFGLKKNEYQASDVNKSYRKLAIRWHPDKLQPGDDPRYFVDVINPCKDELLQ
jgi:curved DNA-binding protein CbpA